MTRSMIQFLYDRGVLPQNLYTEYYGTVNLNNLFKFINTRMHSGAQWEITKVAEACLEVSSLLWPVSTEAFINNSKVDLDQYNEGV